MFNNYCVRTENNINRDRISFLVGGNGVSETGEIKIGDLDEKFMPYIEINEERKRI